MNFFGHAAIATWKSSEPGFVLGAMLPDFAAMIRARPPEARHAVIARGVAFHHATDHVFHDAPTFRRLGAQAVDTLLALGLGRGPARAAAHVGVEILIDGELARDAAARDAYANALAFGTDIGSGELVWSGAGEEPRFFALIAALVERGVLPEHSAPEIVALRVERALAPRTRLALGPGDRERVELWAERTLPRVLEAMDELVLELRAGLG